jgi:hypothetical protein
MSGLVPEWLASKQARQGRQAIESGTPSMYSAMISIYTDVPFKNQRKTVQD